MKLRIITLVFLSGALFVRGQGTFVWDQGFTNLTDISRDLSNQPMGQPFTPTTSSMDAAAFNLATFTSFGQEMDVNVRSGSITGPILGTSSPDTLSYDGVYYFTFSSPIALTPGTQYYLQPVEISGSGVEAYFCDAHPSLTGQAIINGVTYPYANFWFEEGVQVAPEPSLAVLLLIGGGIAYWHRKRRTA